jgi:hypothetical protein
MNLGLLPIPPPAFWNTVPWWSYFVFSAIVLLTVPFVIQVYRGRAGVAVSREQSLAASLDRLERERELQAKMLREDCEACRTELAAERARWALERAALVADRDDGWNAARAMEEVAHEFRHRYSGLAFQHLGLNETIRQIASGRIGAERLAVIVPMLTEPEKLEPVPSLRELLKRKALS